MCGGCRRQLYIVEIIKGITQFKSILHVIYSHKSFKRNSPNKKSIEKYIIMKDIFKLFIHIFQPFQKYLRSLNLGTNLFNIIFLFHPCIKRGIFLLRDLKRGIVIATCYIAIRNSI